MAWMNMDEEKEIPNVREQLLKKRTTVHSACKIKDEASTGEMESDRDGALVECDLPEFLSHVVRWTSSL